MDSTTVDRPKTTPSNLARRWRCPGSGHLEAQVKDSDSDYAQKGRMVHRYWANPNYARDFLTQDEQDLLSLSDRLQRDVLNRLAFEIEHRLHIEQTLSTSDGRLTGTPDRAYVWPQRKSALVSDLKSGFFAVEGAELNLQLRGYAVIEADNCDLDFVYVAILQPRLWTPSERITMAVYDRNLIDASRKQIAKIIDESEKPDAPLRAGEEQCRFCRAKLICPAFREAVKLPLAAFTSDEELSKRRREADIETRVKQCNDEQLEQLHAACKLADSVSPTVNAEMRLRIRNGMMTKFELGKEWTVRKITNARKAVAMLILADVATRDEAFDACELSIDKIEKAYRERTKAKWQIVRDKVNRVLDTVIEKEKREPRILRK